MCKRAIKRGKRRVNLDMTRGCLEVYVTKREEETRFKFGVHLHRQSQLEWERRVNIGILV